MFLYFSINPDVDVGQIEGAYVMGIGYWLTEKAIYDPTTGLELSNSTWVGAYCHCSFHLTAQFCLP